MGYSVDILNNIRENASQEYQNRIPEATRTNLAEIGQAFATYDAVFNEFNENLIQKIGRTIIEFKMFENKLKRFKSGGVTSPHDIEEIYIGMAKSEGAYDPDGKNPLGRRKTDPIAVTYHRENRKDCYAISLGDIDFVKCFRSESALDQYLMGKLNSVYSGDNRDEWLVMKNLITSYKNKDKSDSGYFPYHVSDFATAESKHEWAKEFVKAVRKAVLDQQFLSDKYNITGVERPPVDAKDLVLFIHKDVLVEVDVELLMQAFNQNKGDLSVVPEIVVMDDFNELTDVYAIMVEDGWFKVFDTMFKMEPQRNAQGLFTNYFLHHHQIVSASAFKNAVCFKKETA